MSIRGLASLAPGRPLSLEVRHPDGSSESVEVRHSFTAEQIGWFRAGGALNEIAAAQSGQSTQD